MRTTGLLAASFAVTVLAAGLAQDPRPSLVNGGFEDWVDGLPVAWIKAVAATRSGGSGPHSGVEPGSAGGVALVGDEGTLTWHSLVQSLALEPGTTCRLSFEARLRESRDDPGQYGMRYVGLWFRDAQGASAGYRIRDVSGEAWTSDVLYATVPDQAVSSEVTLALGRTGRLEVRRVELAVLEPEESFAVLVDGLRRSYSHFELKSIDFPALVERHRAALEGVAETDVFLERVQPMLAELRDGHVWIDTPQGQRIVPHAEMPPVDFDLRTVARRLQGVQQFGRTGLVGRTEQGYGYLGLFSFQHGHEDFERTLSACEMLLEAPGLLIDLRANGGGDERRAQRIAALLTDEEHVYARARLRSGPQPDDFGPWSERSIAPAGTGGFAGPIVVLIGPHCVSSGEDCAMMLRALPNATLVGRPTRGSVGNPQPIALPNGLRVWASTWIDALPDGTPVEDRGVPPDVFVEPFAPDARDTGQRVFEVGLKLLHERVRESAADAR